MSTTVTLDEAGRVVIPQALRDELRLSAGDALALEMEGERTILRPIHAVGSIHQEHGIRVFRSGQPLAASVAEEPLERVRQERDTANEGGSP
jgi:AbrB family looped-hinge helix DNA binding protein